MNPEAPEEKKRTLYQMVIEDILHAISRGAFSFDLPICTESSLMQQYGISRITVRRAMAELESRGVIYRKRGVGSFVSRAVYQRQPHTNSSKLFAFIFPFNLTRSGLNDAFQAASGVLMEAGYDASIYITESEPDVRGRDFLAQLSQRGIAGVAYYPKTGAIHLGLLNNLIFQRKPVVLIDIPSPCRYIGSVSSDNFGGSMQLMEHLLGLGHKRIAYVAGVEPDVRTTITDRLSAYVLALEQAGIPAQGELIVTDMTEENRRQINPQTGLSGLQTVLRRLMACGVTAVLCEHDQIAFEITMAGRAQGIDIPRQLSVCGFDRSEWAHLLPEGITTVAQNMEQVGKETARLLLAGLGCPLSVAQQVVVPTQLSIGGTTGAAPDAKQAEGEEQR